MYADLDQLVLSGALFNGTSRSSSPARSVSPDHGWPNTENDSDYDSDVERNKEIEKTLELSQRPQQSIGMGPGRTGVKGVIRDRAEAQSIEREKRKREVDELNRRMEKASLGGKTFLEEERERDWEKLMMEGYDPAALRQNQNGGAGRGKDKFGHLREIGVQGFVSAVEQEAKGVWVVVHIYEPSLDRCYALDATLAQLARHNPQTKFLRTRAGALGFAALPSSRPRPSSSRMQTASARYTDDEDDPYAFGPEEEDSGYADDDDDDSREDEVDLDVLPTLLVYRDGELVHNWVRVDWEAGRESVDELLYKHHILQSSGPGLGNCGLPSDDDDDLLDSDPEIDL